MGQRTPGTFRAYSVPQASGLDGIHPRTRQRTCTAYNALPETGESNAPEPDEIEVSLIDPGYGESVLVHPGDGEWIVADSCVEKDKEGFIQSSAVAYLRKIGVDLARQASRVVATHWHDDHIAGLSKVVGCCESAEFCRAAALGEEEFHMFAALHADSELTPSSRTTKEIVKIPEIPEKRNKKPRFLKSDTLN